jgi:hypothetical protein
MYPPFFRFGRTASPHAAPPLGLIGGGLIMDSGEAERTFIFRCQDRYLIYNGLCGLRSVLFVADGAHLAAYRRLIDALSNRLRVVREFTDLPLDEVPAPLFVPCDIDRLSLDEQPWFREELKRPVIASSLKHGLLLLNQVSPSCATLLSQFKGLAGRCGLELPIDEAELRRLGELALRFHNKARYLDLVRANPEGLPPHAPTALLSAEEFLRLKSWRELIELYTERAGDEAPPRLYVKSAQDSGGNVAALLSAETFEERGATLKREVEQSILWRQVDERESLRSLREEVELAPTLRPLRLTDEQLTAYRNLQKECRVDIGLLVQREIAPPEGARPAFDSVGLTYDIRSPDDCRLTTAAAQLYADADRRHFIGSYISDGFNDEVMTPLFREQMRRLCELFAGQGYRGPINFDARLGPAGEYVLIYDCNPRLSAVYPPLAVQALLRERGLKADSIVSLGYRGEFVYADLKRVLARLASAGQLYTAGRQKGIILLPNLCRDNGFDALLVNMSRAEAGEVVRRGTLQTDSAPESPGRADIF